MQKNERILALADLIEKQPHTRYTDPNGFNMRQFTHSCGTPSCIAGWAVALYEPSHDSYFHGGAAELGLTEDQADDLFYANYVLDNGGSLLDITPSQAAATLRHLAETGEVDWTAGGVK